MSEKLNGPYVNTDRELWREPPGDYYANSIHVTERGSVGINVGGHVIAMPLRGWHEAAKAAAAAEERGRRRGVEERDELRAGMLRLLRDGYGPGGGYYEPDQRVGAAVGLPVIGWGLAPRDSAPVCDNCKRAQKASDGRTEASIEIGPCYCDKLRAPRDSGKES